MPLRQALWIVAGVCIASLAFAADPDRVVTTHLSNGGVAAVTVVAVLLLVARTKARTYVPAVQTTERQDVRPDVRPLANRLADLHGPVASAQRAVRSIAPDRPLPSEGRVRDLLASIERDLDRLGNLVGDAINTAHSDAIIVRRTACNLETIAIDCVRWFETMSPSHRFAIEISGPRWIVADTFRVEQAVRNLVANAVEHSNGRIVIAIAWMDLGVLISVTDEGPGFDPDLRDRILAPQYRGTREGGLGLLIVRRIAEAHGGRMQIASTPGEGATVSFLLPLRGFNHEV